MVSMQVLRGDRVRDRTRGYYPRLYDGLSMTSPVVLWLVIYYSNCIRPRYIRIELLLGDSLR